MSPMDAREMLLRDYLGILQRRRACLFLSLLAAVGLGLLYLIFARPVYQSVARIVVEPAAPARRDVADPFLAGGTDDHDVSTQIEMLQGESLRAQAFRDASVPERAVTLRVKQVGDTDVIELTARSGRPDYAHRLAKTLPAAYLRQVNGNRNREVSNALDFARSRLREESAKLARAELALQRFKQIAQMIDLQKQREAGVAQASDTASAVRRLEQEVRGLQGQYNVLLAARRAQRPYVETPVVTTNAEIPLLENRIADLQTQRESLLILYKPNHPQVQAFDAQIVSLTRRLSRLPATITRTTRTVNPAIADYDAKLAEVRAILAARQAELAQARASGQTATRDLVKFIPLERQQAQLERAVERHRSTVALLTTSVENLSIREKATREPIRTITPATPAEKVWPKTVNVLAAALLVGLLLGVVLALLREHLDDRVQSDAEAQHILDSPVLGHVPLLKEKGSPVLALPNESASADRATALESYRILRANVQFAAAESPVKSLLVSSTAPGEGKTLTAANLAVALALDGKRVILVDADLRAPSVHLSLGLKPQPGLTNVLRRETLLEDALQETEVPGLRVLAAGPMPPNPAELLHSPALRTLHEVLKSQADVVVFDSPPFLACADAQVLSAETDGVLYVVQPGETTKPALSHAAALMDQARANLLGLVFNKVDPAAIEKRYYYGYTRRKPAALDGALLQAQTVAPAMAESRNGARETTLEMERDALLGAREGEGRS